MNGFSEYSQYDALGLAGLVKDGQVSASELLAEACQRLATLNPQCNAVVHQSEAYGRGLLDSLNRDSLFCGVPFLVKDLMLPFKGMPLSNGSRAMQQFVPTENCAMAEQLKPLRKESNLDLIAKQFWRGGARVPLLLLKKSIFPQCQ